MRVVLVTMDSHLASATERAHTSLVKSLPGLSLKVHAASEWGDDPQALARWRPHSATIPIGSR